MNKLLELLLLEAVVADQGIYPMSITYGDGVKTDRTEWQDGWNAASTAISMEWDRLLLHIESIPDKSTIEKLLSDEVLFVSIRDDKISFYVNMNDTFYHACSDAEDVPIKELPIVLEVWKNFSHDGAIAWVSKTRNELPLSVLQTSEFHAAIKFLNPIT